MIPINKPQFHGILLWGFELSSNRIISPETHPSERRGPRIGTSGTAHCSSSGWGWGRNSCAWDEVARKLTGGRFATCFWYRFFLNQRAWLLFTSPACKEEDLGISDWLQSYNILGWSPSWGIELRPAECHC